MSKSYTMREMKSIVDYLVEHRAYAEIKGRKMWMSFASSKLTQRTWQSLKETFLKRILPDINNPYYKLTTEQICSFRQGMDFTQKDKDKLVLQPTNDKTNTSSSSPTTLREIMEGNSNADMDSPKSVEPHHYNTIEELQNDLEVSDKEREEESVEIGHENQDLMSDDLHAKNSGAKDIDASVAIIDKIPENASSSSHEVVTSPNSEKSRNCVESQIIISKNKNYNKEKIDVTQHQKTDNKKADKNTTKISPVIMQKKASTTPDTHLPNNPEEFMNGIDGKEMAKENHLSVPTSEKNKAKKIRSRSHSKNVSSDCDSGNAIKGNSLLQVATYNSHENQGSKVCSDDQNLNEDQVKNVDNETSTRKITKESAPLKAMSTFVENADKPVCSKNTIYDERVYKKPIINGIKTNNKSVKIDDKTKDEVLVLKSYSDSDSDNVTDTKEQQRKEKRKMKRKSANQAALAKMLGFSNVKDNPKRKETTDKNVDCTETRVPSRYISGSEISHTSDDEDRISIVRPKKTKCCNFKPPQPRELRNSGGGLYCSFGNATYPIVMNGQVLTDDQYLFMEENHTKTLKEEREFWKTKFLDQEKKTEHILELLQGMGKKIESQEKVVDELRKIIADFNNDDNAPVSHQSPSVELRPALPKPKKDKRIQIRFSTKNQDVRLKGEWSDICKEFNEMVKIFKSVSPTIEDNETTTKQCDKAIDNVPIIVINEEAADNITEEEAHQNVTKIETEIFNQIAEAEAAEKEKQEKQQRPQKQSNVTKRRRRPTASDKKASSEEGAPSNRVRSRSPQKKPTIDEVNNSKDNKVKEIGLKEKQKPVRQSSRLSNQKSDIVTETKNDKSSDDDDDISIVPQTETSSSSKSFLLSESTRDYQSSDKCQSELYNKKKRKYSFSVSYKDRNKFKRNLRRRIESDFTNDASSESSNITSRHTFKPFAKLFENSTLTNGVQETGKSHNAVQGINETYVISNHTQSSSQATTFTSSSITLPPSPGISSVENLSSDHTLKTNKSCQKYSISNFDVSMPLLRQDCWVKRRTYRSVSEQTTLYKPKELESANYTASRINTKIQQKSALSETLLNKVANVNIVGSPTISASFNKKIHDLLLDSAKKIKSVGLANSSEVIVEKEECMINANVIKAKKKVEPKKRSSTPLKRKSTRKSKPADIEPIIEERMEYCSQSRSSQPSVKSLQQSNTKTIDKCNKIKNRQRGQKNVIKVKILRPKRKDVKVKNKYDTNSSKASLCGSLNIDMQHSDELAHNHSETCLFVDEQGNVQPQRSQTTLARDTSLNCSPKNFNIETVNRDATVFKPDFLNTPINGTHLDNEGNVANTLPTATPMYGSYDSLITNDLSSHVTSPQSQSRNSPWYLLSEDETSKSNTISPQQIPSPIPPAIAQLFPITCAVPNLSTITEASREPDESQKKENIKH